MSLSKDYGNWFKDTPEGTTQDFAGGSLLRGTGDTATYTNPFGKTVNMTSGSDLSELYNNNPNIAAQWNTQYPDTQFPADPNAFNFAPLDLFPTSTSSGTTGSSGSSSGTTHSGINWDSPLMKSLLPQLQSSIGSMPGVLDNFARTIQDRSTNSARQMLGPQAFQGTLNNLNARGVLNSTVAGDALSKTAQPIMQGILNQGYGSNIAEQEARLALPGMLGKLATLGQESSGASSSQNTSAGSSQSYSANPLAPYELASQYFN